MRRQLGAWLQYITIFLAAQGCSGGSGEGSPSAGPTSTTSTNSTTSGTGSGAGGGDPGTTGGIGAPCESTTDCKAGLDCHFDTVNYIGHKQCTAACDLSNPCEDRFGSQTFCIGADICVQSCRDSADCPAKTVCSSNKWCKREGPGSGVPSCGGIATPCSLLGDAQCTSALGCLSDGACTGSAHDCFTYFSDIGCSLQTGCYWSSSSKTCSGVAESCGSMFGQISCTDQEGCRWSSTCTGTPLACSDLTPSTCSDQPGCVLMN
jgi:hypothetical protein